MRIPGKENDRYFCQYCGFPCKEGRDVEGSYQTGWDFSTGETDGSDFISNGSFTTNTTGWTTANCTVAVAAGGQSGNCATLTRTSGAEQYIYQSLSTLEFAVLYRLTAYVKSGTSGNESFALRIMNSDLTRTIYEKTGTTTTTWTQYVMPFRAFYGNNVVCLVKDSSTDGTMLFDTVTLYEYIYSVSENTTACPFCNSKNWKQ